MGARLPLKGKTERPEGKLSGRFLLVALDAVWTDCYCIPMTTTQSTETTYVNLKDSAAELRKALRAAFAGTKFSVRGESYAGGASIHVRWTDGPTVAAVDEIAQGFAGASFDGMTDSMSYVKRDGKHYASDFVFTNRELSEDVYSTALGEIIDAARAEGYEGADDLLAVHRYGTFLPTPVAVWQRTGMSEGPVDAWVRAWIDAR